MSNLEYIADCRIIYYMAISMYYGIPFSASDEFEQVMADFCASNFEENYEMIKSLFVVRYSNKRFSVGFPPELMDIVSRKMDSYKDPKVMNQIYDNVGFEKTQKLTDFAIRNCEYINELYLNNGSTFKQ